MLDFPVVFLWVNDGGSSRLKKAQEALDKSCMEQGLETLHFPAGPDLVLFGDVLKFAREHCGGHAFVWCNSDVTLTHNPYDVPDPSKVYGFHRREIPSHEITHGVDMYYIPIKWWDDCLAKDIPRLYLGASYVDWWISRAMQKAGTYENLTGYIDHVTHEKSGAAAKDADPYYQHNFREYNRWAKRNGLEAIPAPPILLPGVGHVWGIRNAIQRIRRKIQEQPPL
jgi:hypothetical protein